MALSKFVKSDPSESMLRRRRCQILEDKKEEERVKDVIKKSIVGSQHSNHILKTFLVVITALLCTIGSLIHYTNPNLIKHFWKKPIPTFHLATRYPRNVLLERDLPRFFRYYSIVTPENVEAREAVRKVVQSRKQLRRRAGRMKMSVKAWDDSNVEQLVKQQICGDKFELVYRNASQKRQDDLLMWCLLASRVTEGFFKESVEILDSPLFLTRKRGIAVRKQPPAGVEDGYGALSTSFYLHPRVINNTAIDWIPSKLFGALLSSSGMEGYEDDQEVIERSLYELIVAQGHENDFLVLDEICQENRPKRSVAFVTGDNADRCYFVVPEKYGGNFDPREDDE